MVQVNFLNSNESKAILTGMLETLKETETQAKLARWRKEQARQNYVNSIDTVRAEKHYRQRISDVCAGLFANKKKAKAKKDQRQANIERITEFTIHKELPEIINMYYKIYKFKNGKLLIFKEVENCTKRIIIPNRCIQFKEFFADTVGICEVYNRL